LLPFVDAHATDVDAPPARVWAALLESCPGAHAGGVLRVWAWLWGADPPASNGLAAHVIGAERPGLVVREVVAPATWAAAGRHRFARYQVVFRIDPRGTGSRLTAETYAAFTGTPGRVYRFAVLTLGPHTLVVRGVLAYVRRRAEARSAAGETHS